VLRCTDFSRLGLVFVTRRRDEVKDRSIDSSAACVQPGTRRLFAAGDPAGGYAVRLSPESGAIYPLGSVVNIRGSLFYPTTSGNVTA